MLSREMRLLKNRWQQNRQNWPQFLDWIEVTGLRGWSGQRVSLPFPIMAIVGENGTGKSTLLQAAAAVYKPRQGSGERGFFASDFFPATAWDTIGGVTIRGFCRQGNNTFERSVRRPTARWLGNRERRERTVRFLDLRRTQPIYARVGYARIAKSTASEAGSVDFDDAKRARASTILGKTYDEARHATTDMDGSRAVPVLKVGATQYSGFHQGAGENAIADLLAETPPETSLVLIDELETSLHPRAQRRLIRDLAQMARLHHLQILITTHSPYVLEELPAEARIYVRNNQQSPRDVLHGVSASYAMTFMDDEDHPEVDVCVEDSAAKIFVEEMIAAKAPELMRRIQIVPFGAANVGQALGQMVAEERFPRPTVVLLDGDQDVSAGVVLLPGDDAPERVIFTRLLDAGLPDVAARTGREHAQLVNAIEAATHLPDHHDWVNHAANTVVMGGDHLWRALCSAYVKNCLTDGAAQSVVDEIELRLG